LRRPEKGRFAGFNFLQSFAHFSKKSLKVIEKVKKTIFKFLWTLKRMQLTPYQYLDEDILRF